MKSLSPRMIAGLAIAAVIVVVFAIVVISSRGSSDGTPDAGVASAESTTTTTSTDGDPSGATSSTTSADAPPDAGGDSGFKTPEAEALPLDVSVSPTTGLSDGDTVSVHVTPHDGSSIYGVEAFLCKADATFLLDADIRPSQTGKCIGKPLSADSMDYVNVAIDPPYQSADVEFRVGVGTDTYKMRQGSDVAITCGPSSPCQLVLKLQIPNGYGFQAYPVTFA